MIAQIRISKIIKFKYEPKNIPTGVINGIKWQLFLKKQIGNNIFRYVFMLTVNNNRGGSISGTRTLITGDMDIREAAEILINDHITNQRY